MQDCRAEFTAGLVPREVRAEKGSDAKQNDSCRGQSFRPGECTGRDHNQIGRYRQTGLPAQNCAQQHSVVRLRQEPDGLVHGEAAYAARGRTV